MPEINPHHTKIALAATEALGHTHGGLMIFDYAKDGSKKLKRFTTDTGKFSTVFSRLETKIAELCEEKGLNLRTLPEGYHARTDMLDIVAEILVADTSLTRPRWDRHRIRFLNRFIENLDLNPNELREKLGLLPEAQPPLSC